MAIRAANIIYDVTGTGEARIKRVRLPGGKLYWCVFADGKRLSTHLKHDDASVQAMIHNQAVERLRPKTEPLIEEARKALGLDHDASRRLTR